MSEKELTQIVHLLKRQSFTWDGDTLSKLNDEKLTKEKLKDFS